MDGENKLNTPLRSHHRPLRILSRILYFYLSPSEGPRRVTKSEIDFDRLSLRRQFEESKRIPLPSSKRISTQQQENGSDSNPRKCDSNEGKESIDSNTPTEITSQFETIYVHLQSSVSSRSTRKRIFDSTLLEREAAVLYIKF